MSCSSPPPTLLLGPTGSGKSNAILSLAQKSPLHIICGDALQLFKGLSILTAQPSDVDKKQVPHALYEHLPPHAPLYDAARFVTICQKTIHTVEKQGQLPIVVGGTGFYLKALLEGLPDMPAVSSDILENLENTPTADLWKQLMECDPCAAEKLNPHDRQRLLRALSLNLETQKPLSYWHQRSKTRPTFAFRVIVLLPEPEILKQHITLRFQKMWKEGVIDEVVHFANTYLQNNETTAQSAHVSKPLEPFSFAPLKPSSPSPSSSPKEKESFFDLHTALTLKTKGLKEALIQQKGLFKAWPAITRALGFTEIVAAHKGLLSYHDAQQIMLTRTLQYAKRQRTWIRHQVTPQHVFTSATDLEKSNILSRNARNKQLKRT